MSCLDLEKNELVNLKYSLAREFLLTNKFGTYCSSTIIFCPTRKYHGMLVPYISSLAKNSYVLLSNMHETVIHDGNEFNLGIHKYPFNYEPRGHKYVVDFKVYPTPKIHYSVGGIHIEKELVLAEDSDQLIIKYTLAEAKTKKVFRFKPFLAFRQIHHLSKSNLVANPRFSESKNGASFNLYAGFPELHIQLSRKNEYIHSPNWYNDVEYMVEQQRGYDFKEDLLQPGYFEVELKPGESVYLSASTQEVTASALKRKFESEVKKHTAISCLEGALKKSASQFIVERDSETQVIAGYHWFGRWGRDTFIALPGLSLSLGKVDEYKRVMTSMSRDIKNGLFPNMGTNGEGNFYSVDAPMWFFWALQQYVIQANDTKWVWKNFGDIMKQILNAYRQGTDFGIKMHPNYLIFSGIPGKALTWMDAIVDGKPVTPRSGYVVEINALWYNAVLFTLGLAKEYNDKSFCSDWEGVPTKIASSILETFWSKEKRYLADVVIDGEADWSVRPNQIFMVSMPNKPLNDEINKAIIERVGFELLTPRGLRTLSPKNKNYQGRYFGSQPNRDRAYHQGTVWPWLLGHYVEAYLSIHEENGISYVKELLEGFNEEMCIAGMGSVSEVFDGDPPHHYGGTISQAWSVAEIIRIMNMIKKYEVTKNKQEVKSN